MGKQGDIHIRITSDASEAVKGLETVAAHERKVGREAEEAARKSTRANQAVIDGARRRGEMTRAEAVALKERARAYERIFTGPELSRASVLPTLVQRAPRPVIGSAQRYTPTGASGGGRDAIVASVQARNAAEMARLQPLMLYQAQETAQMERAALEARKRAASEELARIKADAQSRGTYRQEIESVFGGRDAIRANVVIRNAAEMAKLAPRKREQEYAKVFDLVEANERAKQFKEEEARAAKELAWKRNYYDAGSKIIAMENKITSSLREQGVAVGRLGDATMARRSIFRGFASEALRQVGVIGMSVGGIATASQSLQSRREALDKRYSFEDTVTPLVSFEGNADKAPAIKRDILEASVVNRIDPQEIADMKFAKESAKAYIPSQDLNKIEQMALLSNRATGTPLKTGMDALTNTWNAYSDELGTPEMMASKLKMTADLGKMTPEHLATFLPDVISGAKATDRPIDEVLAALITSTNAGGSVEKTFTGARTFFARLEEAKKKGFNTNGLSMQEIVDRINTLPPERMVEYFGQEGISFAESLSRKPELYEQNLRAVQAVKGNELQAVYDARMRDAAYRQAMDIAVSKQLQANAPIMGWRAEQVSTFDRRQQQASAGWAATAPMSMQWMAGGVGFLEAAHAAFADWMGGGTLEKLPAARQAYIAPFGTIGKMEKQMLYYSQGRPEEAKMLDMTPKEQQRYWDAKAASYQPAQPTDQQVAVYNLGQSFAAYNQTLQESGWTMKTSMADLQGAIEDNTDAVYYGGGTRDRKWYAEERARNRAEGVVPGYDVQGSHAAGVAYVPYDQNVRVHRGEQIVPAQVSPVTVTPVQVTPVQVRPVDRTPHPIGARNQSLVHNADFDAWNKAPGQYSTYALNDYAHQNGNANFRAWQGQNGPMSDFGVWNGGGQQRGLEPLSGTAAIPDSMDRLASAVEENTAATRQLNQDIRKVNGVEVGKNVPVPVSRGVMRGE